MQHFTKTDEEILAWLLYVHLFCVQSRLVDFSTVDVLLVSNCFSMLALPTITEVRSGITWCHMTPCNPTWCHMTPCNPTWCHMTPCNATWCHVHAIPHDVTWHHAMPHDVTWHHVATWWLSPLYNTLFSETWFQGEGICNWTNHALWKVGSWFPAKYKKEKQYSLLLGNLWRS